MDEAGTWNGGRLKPRRLCVRCGPSPLHPKGGGAPSPIFGPFLLWQTAACIKMPLGMDVRLSPGDFVLDGDPVPFPKGHSPPIFGPYLLRPNGCMDQDVTWYGGRPRPRRLCVRRGPRCPSPKGRGADPPIFRFMFIVTRRLYA